MRADDCARPCRPHGSSRCCRSGHRSGRFHRPGRNAERDRWTVWRPALRHLERQAQPDHIAARRHRWRTRLGHAVEMQPCAVILGRVGKGRISGTGIDVHAVIDGNRQRRWAVCSRSPSPSRKWSPVRPLLLFPAPVAGAGRGCAVWRRPGVLAGSFRAPSGSRGCAERPEARCGWPWRCRHNRPRAGRRRLRHGA